MRYVLVLVVMLWVTSAGAENGKLLKQMELEIQLHRLSIASYEAASLEVRGLIRKTSLWQEYQDVHTNLMAELKDRCITIGYATDNPDYLPREQDIKRMCKYGKGSPPWREFNAAEQLAAIINSIRDKFVEQIYHREMKDRLAELKVSFTKELRKRITALYKRHSA